MWGFLVALISGALMSVQGVFNTEVTKQTSLWVSTGWVQLSAFCGMRGSVAFYRTAEHLEHSGKLKINIHCWVV